MLGANEISKSKLLGTESFNFFESLPMTRIFLFRKVEFLIFPECKRDIAFSLTAWNEGVGDVA
jgi:hypothetical protein